MEDVFDKEENAKNIYVIKHKLGGLTRGPRENHFEWSIGHFVVRIYPKEIQDLTSPYLFLPPKQGQAVSKPDCILQYEKVDVHVEEEFPNSPPSYINLSTDKRFKDYKPIQYNVVRDINLSDGRGMPIIHLCELIRYLHRLSNLTAFL
jgi:hypothetical protein